jgi:hypothetical protein
MQRDSLLGFMVYNEVKKPDSKNIEVIINVQPPTIIKGMQKVLSHIRWYKDIMHNYTSFISLTNVTKRVVPFNWTLEC